MVILLDLLKRWNVSNRQEEALAWLYAHYSEMSCIVDSNELADTLIHAQRLIDNRESLYSMASHLCGFSRHQVLGLAVSLAWYWGRDLVASNLRLVSLEEICKVIQLDPKRDIPYILNEFRLSA